jgi:hypothetical protein
MEIHNVNQSFSLDLSLKVTVESISNHSSLTQDEIEKVIAKMRETLLRDIFHVIDNSDDISYQEIDVDRVGLSFVTLHVN